MRQIKKCLNCRDEREIVAHGLCAKCYMGHRREQGRRQEQVTLAEDAAEAANSATGGKSVAAAAGATAGAATQQIPLHTTTDDLKKYSAAAIRNWMGRRRRAGLAMYRQKNKTNRKQKADKF